MWCSGTFPQVPVVDATVTPLLILTEVGAPLLAAGAIGYRRGHIG